MAITTKQIDRLKATYERQVLGTGCRSGLAQDMTINRYSFSYNEDGDRESLTLLSSSSTKAVVVASNDGRSVTRQNLRVEEGEVRVHVSLDADIFDTDEVQVEFVLDGETYLMRAHNRIGRIAGSNGIARELLLRPKV